MAKKIIALNTEKDVFILGVSCHQKGFKLAWEINKALGCQLQLIPEFELPDVNYTEGYVYFNWEDPSEHYDFHLLSNHSENGVLFGKMKHVDYFFIVTGFYEEVDTRELSKKIRNISSVLTVFEAKIEQLRGIERK